MPLIRIPWSLRGDNSVKNNSPALREQQKKKIKEGRSTNAQPCVWTDFSPASQKAWMHTFRKGANPSLSGKMKRNIHFRLDFSFLPGLTFLAEKAITKLKCLIIVTFNRTLRLCRTVAEALSTPALTSATTPRHVRSQLHGGATLTEQLSFFSRCSTEAWGRVGSTPDLK